MTAPTPVSAGFRSRPASDLAPPRPGGPTRRITAAHALDSEWAKIRTVRSTYWALFAVVLVSVGLSLAIAAVYSASWDTLTPEQRATVDISLPLGGISFGVLVISVLGVMAISSEYSTGMIRTSLTALPRRGLMLGAKLAVLAGLCLVIGLVVAFVSYAVAEPFYAAKGVSLPLNGSGNLRAVVFAGIYLALVAVLGFAIGALLRHTAGAVTTVLGLMFVLPIITSLLPGRVGRGLNKVMPSNAGSAMMMTYSNDTSRYLSPVDGLLVLLGTVAVLTAVAFAAFKRRDA